MSSIQSDIEERLAVAEPDVEVLLAEVVGGSTLRLFIDHPSGVSLELCERVTNHLAPLRATYALEVSSPGPERPLTRPEHFRSFLGRRAHQRHRRARRRQRVRRDGGRA
jgi:ribosome maturation factor RimP